MAHDFKKQPLRPTQIASTFSKFHTTAYHDTATSRGPSSSAAGLPPPHYIRTLAWSPLGNLIATGTGDRKLRVWNPERAHVKHSTELRGHTGTVERVAWNPVREAELASVSVDGSVRIWDIRSGKNIADIKTPGKEGFSLVWRPDGTEMVVGTKDDTLIKISRLTNTEISRHPQSGQTNHSAFSHSGQDLFLTSGDGSIRILDYPSLETLHDFKAHNSSSFCTEVSPTGRLLAVGGTDALLTLWDTKDWFCTRSLSKMNGPVRTLSFSWCGGYLVSGGEEDRGIEIVHVETGAVLHSVKGPPAPVVQWSPKDYAIAYAAHEGNGGLRVLSGNILSH